MTITLEKTAIERELVNIFNENLPPMHEGLKKANGVYLRTPNLSDLTQDTLNNSQKQIESRYGFSINLSEFKYVEEVVKYIVVNSEFTAQQSQLSP